MKRVFYILYFLGTSYLTWGQQEQHFSQYMVNQYLINPALGGTEDFTDIKLGHRRQWVGFEHAPKTSYLTTHTTLGRDYNARDHHHKGEHKSWSGIGGYVFTDNTGPINRTAFYGQYSFNMPLTKKIRLSTGAFLGLKQYRYDFSGLRRESTVDPAIVTNQMSTEMKPDMSIGLWMYSNSFYAGLSLFQLLKNKISYQGAALSGALNNGYMNRHLFITSGLRLPVAREINIIPSFLLKAVTGAPVSADLNLKLDYTNKFFVGLSYRTQDAFALIIGTIISHRFEMSYSYDVTTSSIRQASSGSHEIIVGFRIVHKGRLMCPSRFW